MHETDTPHPHEFELKKTPSKLYTKVCDAASKAKL
jgi:hypothetical protein